jgi:hypothetical protein
VTYSVVSGSANVSGSTLTINGAGQVTVRATYAAASADQTFTVAPAVLRVLADSKTRIYGAPNPTFTAQYQGFKYNDGPGVLAGTLSFNVTALNAVGVYPGAIVPNGVSAANYSMQFSSATLTVEKASTTTASGNYSRQVPGTVNLVAQVSPDAPSTQTVAGGTVTFIIRQGATNIAQVTFSGKVLFVFGVKYLNAAATTPSGITGLTLDVPGLKFVATKYNWLNVSSPQAQFSGIGSVNGAAGYDFLVTGLVGKLQGKKVPDKLRIKVWNHATGQVVYDNQQGAPNNAAPAVALGGGDVTVHK